MKLAFFLPLGATAIAVLGWALPASAQAPAPATKTLPGKEYKLTRRSAFTGLEGVRNPFWPIGWVPTAAIPSAPQEALPEVSADSFVVTSISLDGQPLAVINGRTYGVGDRIPVNATGTEAVAVSKIVDGAVFFTFHGREIRSLSTHKGGGGPR